LASNQPSLPSNPGPDDHHREVGLKNTHYPINLGAEGKLQLTIIEFSAWAAGIV
jgi:hypothetical protein